MMRQSLAAAAALCVMVAVAPLTSTLAHHSTSMYNMDNPVTVTGEVVRFEWTNPHAFIYLEVQDADGNKILDADGKPVTWEVEMMSLNHLRSYGWTRDTVKPGDVISCTGGAAKNGDPSMISSYMVLGDGREIKS